MLNIMKNELTSSSISIQTALYIMENTIFPQGSTSKQEPNIITNNILNINRSHTGKLTTEGMDIPLQIRFINIQPAIFRLAEFNVKKVL
jgi:hypothetical protein